MEKLRFRRKSKFGTHRFRSNGKMVVVRAGETIQCTREDLGSRFNINQELSQYECLDLDFSKDLVKPARVPEIVPNGKKGWYDVVNPDFPDRPLNEKPMRKIEAEEFLQLVSSGAVPPANNQEEDQDKNQQE